MDLAIAEKERNTSSNLSLALKVFDEHGDFIRTIIRFHIKNDAEAEDLFQDFFLFLISKPIPEDVQNVRGFLYRLISDKAKDTIRRIERYRGRIRRYAEHCKHIIENQPESIVVDVEEAKKMFELIQKRLPPKEAQAITLRYEKGRDIREVARKMRINPRSASRYVCVGLKKIRQVIG